MAQKSYNIGAYSKIRAVLSETACHRFTGQCNREWMWLFQDISLVTQPTCQNPQKFFSHTVFAMYQNCSHWNISVFDA